MQPQVNTPLSMPPNECTKETFHQIKQCVNGMRDTKDAAITGEYNQNTASKEISKFHEEIGVDNVHHKHDNAKKMSYAKQMWTGQHQ